VLLTKQYNLVQETVMLFSCEGNRGPYGK